MDCSAGTYIRSLAADLGTALGGGAHLHNLRRTAIGSFGVDAATALEEVTLLPAAEAMRDLDPVTVPDDVAVDVSFGRILPVDLLGGSRSGPYPVLDESGLLLAVYETHKAGTAKPSVVLVEPITPAEPPAPEVSS